MHTAMPRFYWVLYDGECGLCRRARYWLSRQRQLIPLRFLHLQSPRLEDMFPGISAYRPSEELVLVSDTGEVYQGAAAWVTVLYTLDDLRGWAFALADPDLLPMARRLVHALSSNRLGISELLGWEVKTEDALKEIDRIGETCVSEVCGLN